MSTQVQLKIVDDETDEEMLGHLTAGASGQLLSSMAGTRPSIDEEMEALGRMDTHIVGTDLDEYPKRVRRAINGVQEIDEVMIDTIRPLGQVDDEDTRCDPDSVVEFLEDHVGERVFVVSA